MNLNKYYLLVGIIANHGITASKAWNIPVQLKDRLEQSHQLTIDQIDKLSLEQFINLFENPTKLHRFNRTVATYIYKSITMINEEYGGDFNKLLVNNNHLLISNLIKLPGMSEKKAKHLLVYLCAIDENYHITNQEYLEYTKDCEQLIIHFDDNLSYLKKAFN